MIYLCSVYSLNAGAELMEKRYNYAAKRTALFMKEGHTIFCPINHCHPIAVQWDMPKTWEFWRRHDLNYIAASDEVWVLMMPNWRDSIGITAEIEFAELMGKKITYIDCYDYKE